MGDKVMLHKVKVKWAKVQAPCSNFNEDGMEYTLDVQLTDEKIAELGLNPKTTIKVDEEDGTKYVTFRKPTVSKQGNELVPVIVIGRDKQPFDGMLGNGTTANVRLDAYAYTSKKFGDGISYKLDIVQVVDLVEYSSDDLGGFDELDAAEGSGTDDDFDVI